MIDLELIDNLRRLVGPDGVLDQPEDLIVFEYDGYLEIGRPDLVVQPRSVEQVAEAVRLAAGAGLPVVARGAATGLSGGAVAVRGGLVVDFNRLGELRALHLDDRLALVQPGLVNSELSAAVAPDGYYYAPDPSSQRASTIGGNIAENAGGPHCLARGMTTNHVAGLELVTSDGLRYALGGAAPDSPGYDLTGLVVGSEGTLGLVAEAWVRLLPLPPTTVTLLATFDQLEQAGAVVSAIVAAGLIPAALELVDGGTAAAIEQALRVGMPTGGDGVLLIDLDGRPEDVAEEAAIAERLCRQGGATDLRRAEGESERAALWAGRKGALAALAHIAPNYYLHDMVVPRSRLAEVLREVLAIGAAQGFFISNVTHAGDGNLHPTIMFDLREHNVLERVIAAGEAILRVGVAAGGTISGEHGIGLEKRDYLPWIFDGCDLDVMRRVRAAFDPQGRLNPDKVFPGERARPPRIKVWASAAVGPEDWI